MITLAVVITVATLVYQISTRMTALDAAIADLTTRVNVLERRPTAPVVPAAVAPRATPPVQPVRPVQPAVPTARPAPPALPASNRDALEVLIGGRWLLYVGVVAVVVGIAYFEKLAIDNHWVTETWRVLQGGAIGLLLIAAGLQFVRRGYRLYGQLVSGSGVAILYVSTYAAFNFYHLVSQPIAFGLMSAVTALAAWLADRQRSQGLALVAVGGGFATPFLLPSATDAQAALFGYDACLVAGTLLLSRRRDWPTLNIVSYGFTVMTSLAWAASFYTPSKYLVTELFLTLFCAMFLYILYEIRGSDHPSAGAERAILWTAPLLYYVGSLVNLADHSSALLIYLVLLAVTGAIVGVRAGSRARLAFWVAVAAPLLVWSGAHGTTRWLAAGISTWLSVYLVSLTGLVHATVDDRRRFAAADIAVAHLNGLVAYFGAYLLLDPVRSAACAPLAAGFAVFHVALALLIAPRLRDEALHFGAVAFTLTAIAIGLQFDGVWMTGAWAAEGAAVIWLGVRERRRWLHLGGVLLFGVAIGQLIGLQFDEPMVGQHLLFNSRAACALFVIALTYAVAAAHRRQPEFASATEVGAALLVAKFLVLSTAASEIVAFWTLHKAPPFEPVAQVVDAAFVVGAVITWLGLRRQEAWFRAAGAAVIAIAVLTLFAIQLRPAPIGYVTLLNGRAGAGVLAVVVLVALARIHRRLGDHLADLPVQIAILTTAAGLLALSLLTSEIDAYWSSAAGPDVWSVAREGLRAIAWAGVGGFLVWHGLTIRRVWTRAIGAALLAVGVLQLLRLQFVPAGAAYIVLANAKAMASVAIVVLLYGLAHIYRTADVAERRFAPSATLLLVANALTLTLASSEIVAYWHVHDLRTASAYTSATSYFAREMMLSIAWAVYATLLVVIGLWKRYAPIRYFAMTVFVMTIVKVFAVDLAELDRLYRVLSVIGLGVMLLLTSYLYQSLNAEPTGT